MAAPTYIRSLSSSFSSAGPHHSPSAWASAASHHLNTTPSINSHNHLIYTHHLQSFNSHNDRNYTHHLHQASMDRPQSMRKMPPGLSSPASSPAPRPSGAGGRRRSASIRMAPPSYIKFDPFADDPLLPVPSPAPTPLTSSSYANRQAGSAAPSNTPYTIQIPAAAPTEIQRYTPAASARRIAFPPSSPAPLNLGSPAGRINGGNSGPHAPRLAHRTPPTSTPRQASGPGALGGPNVSKLVAGILLNRVHAVGKPMRRRVPSFGEKKEYVKSCLSSVVSVEA